jgi:hypothetical protein
LSTPSRWPDRGREIENGRGNPESQDPVEAPDTMRHLHDLEDVNLEIILRYFLVVILRAGGGELLRAPAYGAQKVRPNNSETHTDLI